MLQAKLFFSPNFSKEQDKILKSHLLVLLFVCFTDNAIDIECLKLLNDADIAQLIPKIGLRLKFSQQWKKYVSC